MIDRIHLSEEQKQSQDTLSQLKDVNRKLDRMYTDNGPKRMVIEGAETVAIRGPKGESGERGEIGPVGPSGKSIIGPRGPRGDKGIRGEIGRDGKSIVGPVGPEGKAGLDGSPDTPDEIVSKINSALKKIDPKQVRGLLALMENMRQMTEYPTGIGAGGRAPAKIQSSGSTIQRQPTALNFTGATVTDDGNGITTIAIGAGGTAVYDEEVSGSGTTWTLAHTPNTGTLRVYLNGMRAKVGAGNDYTLSGDTVTTALSWTAGQVLAEYLYT